MDNQIAQLFELATLVVSQAMFETRWVHSSRFSQTGLPESGALQRCFIQTPKHVIFLFNVNMQIHKGANNLDTSKELIQTTDPQSFFWPEAETVLDAYPSRYLGRKIFPHSVASTFHHSTLTHSTPHFTLDGPTSHD